MDRQNIKSQTKQQNIGIYIHIPFCVKKCHYCDFLSMPASALVQQEYVEALCAEIKEEAKEAGNRMVDTIYIGGGTPTVLEPGHIRRILDTVYEAFSVSHTSENTLEANPGTVSREGMGVYRASGINRVSMGMQTADRQMLRKLGRIHTAEDYMNSVELVRASGIENISTDIMFSLPGQTEQMLTEALTVLFEQEIQHISAYGLIVEEGTAFYQWVEGGQMSEADEELDRKMYHTIVELCERKGYHQYEISNFAREGYESRHNIKYWTMQEYMGVGLGASGFMGGKRYANVRELGEYMSRPACEKRNMDSLQKLTKEMQMEEWIFLGLRMTAGVSHTAFIHQFGVGIEELFGRELSRLKQEGLLMEKNECLMLTKKGIDVSNYVMSFFLF